MLFWKVGLVLWWMYHKLLVFVVRNLLLWVCWGWHKFIENGKFSSAGEHDIVVIHGILLYPCCWVAKECDSRPSTIFSHRIQTGYKDLSNQQAQQAIKWKSWNWICRGNWVHIDGTYITHIWVCNFPLQVMYDRQPLVTDAFSGRFGGSVHNVTLYQRNPCKLFINFKPILSL